MKQRTYDIINAGSRNRFMASGIIVSNSSRGTNLQNLARGGKIKTILSAVDDILTGADIESVQMLHGAPLVVASDMLRPAFIAPDDHWMARGDYSQIEARVLAWMAGEQRVLQAFRDYDTILDYDAEGKPIRKGPDLYRIAGSAICGVPPTELTDTQRQIGKVSTLACIAEGQLVLTSLGLIPIERVTLSMKLWDGKNWVSHDGIICKGERDCIDYDGLTATPDHTLFVEDFPEAISFGQAAEQGLYLHQAGLKGENNRTNIKRSQTQTKRRVWDVINAGPNHCFTVSGRLVHNCGFAGGVGAFHNMARIYNLRVSDEEALSIRDAWRETNPNIVALWKKTEDAAFECMREGPGTQSAIRPGTWFTRGRRVLVLHMPSDRSITYWYPRIEKQQHPWGIRDSIMCFSENAVNKQFTKNSYYGGIFVQNMIQGLARDIMANGLVNLDERNLNPLLSVHDEALCQVPKARYSLAKDAADAVTEAMLMLPNWCLDLPTAVDSSAAKRYYK